MVKNVTGALRAALTASALAAIALLSLLSPTGLEGRRVGQGCFEWCFKGGACGADIAAESEGISQHLPMTPSPPTRFQWLRFLRRKKKSSSSNYLKRVAEKAIQTYSTDLEQKYQEFRRDLNKRRDRSWEQTLTKESETMRCQSYRRMCPQDFGALEYDQSTVYENASVSQLDKFYRDDTHRAAQDGSTESLEILANDDNSQAIVIYQLVRYPWPLTNREYLYIRRRFTDGDKCYYIMQAVKGREVLPDEEPDDEDPPWLARCGGCAAQKKQRVEDFTCYICFSPAKPKEGCSEAVEWRQRGVEDFGIRNPMLTRAAKVAAAKSLWPFQIRLEGSFRRYSSTTMGGGDDRKPTGPVREVLRSVGWIGRQLRGGVAESFAAAETMANNARASLPPPFAMSPLGSPSSSSPASSATDQAKSSTSDFDYRDSL
mmetsp:Transcript_5358/g.10501  ORF Transcript_5358/g.10501 Transcript_5358/m.10501 type:complete len:430 (-) Transcript_5358:141-1430(-)